MVKGAFLRSTSTQYYITRTVNLALISIYFPVWFLDFSSQLLYNLTEMNIFYIIIYVYVFHLNLYNISEKSQKRNCFYMILNISKYINNNVGLEN